MMVVLVAAPIARGQALEGPVESTTPIEDRPSNVEDRTARSWPNGLLA